MSTYKKFILLILVFIGLSCNNKTNNTVIENRLKISSDKPNLILHFDVEKSGYYFLQLHLLSSADWGNSDCTSTVIGIYNQLDDENILGNVIIWKNDFNYNFFLGEIEAGAYSIKLSYSSHMSICNKPLYLESVNLSLISDDMSDCAKNLPFLIGFKNNNIDDGDIHNLHSDLPMFWVCNKENNTISYILYYSNEDGGTGLVPGYLMHEWGRFADIENAFTIDLSSNKSYIRDNETKDSEFTGSYYQNRPLLQVNTLNGLIGEGNIDQENVMFSLPFTISTDLPTREDYLEIFPYSYEIMAKESLRENKIDDNDKDDQLILSSENRYIFLDQYFSCDNCTPEYYLKITLKTGDVIYSYKHNGSDNDLDKYQYSDTSYKRRAVKLPLHSNKDNIKNIEICNNTTFSGNYFVYKMFLLDKDNLPNNILISPPGKSFLITGNNCIVIYK